MDCKTCENYKPKPEHYDGEPCTLPIIRGELPEGQMLVYTGEYRTIPSNKHSWHDARPSQDGAYFGWIFPEPRWILRAVPIKPEPKYPIDSWVMPLYGNPCRVIKPEHGACPYTLITTSGEIIYHVESHLRSAIREDFMVEFGGVKVWMEEHNGTTKVCWDWGPEVGEELLYSFQITIYKTAGVMFMPEEFWE